MKEEKVLTGDNNCQGWPHAKRVINAIENWWKSVFYCYSSQWNHILIIFKWQRVEFMFSNRFTLPPMFIHNHYLILLLIILLDCLLIGDNINVYYKILLLTHFYCFFFFFLFLVCRLSVSDRKNIILYRIRV